MKLKSEIRLIKTVMALLIIKEFIQVVSHMNVVSLKILPLFAVPLLGIKEFIQGKNLILVTYVKIVFTKLTFLKNDWPSKYEVNWEY